MTREEFEGQLKEGRDKAGKLWGEDRRRAIAESFDAAFASDGGEDIAGIGTVTIARTAGRTGNERWYASEESGEIPLIVAAIECKASAQTMERIVANSAYDANATCADSETPCEVLRRNGHPDEARVLALLTKPDPQGAGNARPSLSKTASAWPAQRMDLWKAHGAVLDVTECLHGTCLDESPGERWTAVADAVGEQRADEMVAVIGEWEPTSGSWPESEAGALRELGEAQAKNCDTASLKAVRELVERLAKAGEDTGQEREEIAKRWKRWQRAGGAPGTAGLRTASAQVRSVLNEHPQWRAGWTHAAERSLVYTANAGRNLVTAFEAALEHEIAMDGMLSHPAGRDGDGNRDWRPVLNIAVLAGARADLVQRLIDAGARPASCDRAGRNVWHVLMAHDERPGEPELVEVLAMGDPHAMLQPDVNGHRPEDCAGQSWNSHWPDDRVRRFRNAGAEMDALTVIQTTAHRRHDAREHVARWRLAVEAPGGAQRLFETGPKGWGGEFRNAPETPEEVRKLAQSIVSSARSTGYDPMGMAQQLCSEDHARGLGGTRMICAVVKTWTELGTVLDETPQWRLSVARAALATRCGASDEEESWLETLFTTELGEHIDPQALVECAKECARAQWPDAIRRIGNMSIAQGVSLDGLIDAVIDTQGRDAQMMRTILEIDAVRTYVRNETGKNERRSVAVALRRWSVASAEALREAGAVLDETTAAKVIESGAEGCLHGEALTWSRKWLSQALRDTRIAPGTTMHLVNSGRRDVLEWMAREGHAKRVVRAAAQAARKSSAGLGEQVLGIMAELGVGEKLSAEHQRAGARHRKGWRRVVVLGGRLARACGLGPQWAYEGMVSTQVRLIECLGARRIGARDNGDHSDVIDLASAIAHAQGHDPEALAEALQAQGWTPRGARQIGAVVQCPGRPPRDTLTIACALAVLGKQRAGKARKVAATEEG